MSWQEYVKRHVRGRSQVELAATVGVSQAAVSRWLKGTQGVNAAVAIDVARALGDSPMAALVAAGLITEAEAKVRPIAAPDYTQLSNDELLELVRSRMTEGGEGHDRPPATTEPAPGPAKKPGKPHLKTVEREYPTEITEAARPDEE